MDGLILWSVALTGLFILVHLAAGKVHALVGSEKRPLYSVLAGITTAYLFLKLLPELGEHTFSLPGLTMVGIDEVEALLFGIALIGFIAYYAIEVWARSSTRYWFRDAPVTGARVYRIHLGAFAVFNAAVAFLLPRYLTLGVFAALVYTFAIAVHLLMLDHALAEMHGGRYGSQARVIHSASLCLGLVVALLVGPEPTAEISEPLLAFLAGAIALNVIKEEVPPEKDGRPLAFALGALIFGLVMAGGIALDLYV